MITTQRIQGWKSGLKEMVLNYGSIPFGWGSNDCMTLASKSVKIMTGKDILSGLGEYHTKHEAIEAVNDLFGLGFLETFTRLFNEAGFEPVNHFRLGCVGLIKVQNLDQEAADLFDGVTLATGLSEMGHVFCPGRSGLVLIHKYERVKSWKL
jgi:hypothetical protein